MRAKGTAIEAGRGAGVTPTPSAAEEARLDDLYRQMRALKSDLRMESRAYTNGIRYGAHPTTTAACQRSYAETAAAYNEVVAAINALTAPYRAARAAQEGVAARARRDAAAAQRRAELRAAACGTCGLVHAGEC